MPQISVLLPHFFVIIMVVDSIGTTVLLTVVEDLAVDSLTVCCNVTSDES